MIEPLPPSLLSSPQPLKELTTLEVGGAPQAHAHVRTAEELKEVSAWASARGLLLCPLGGGSNVLCADEPLNALVVSVVDESLSYAEPLEGRVSVTVGAGVVWDQLVAQSVARGLAGVECLSGIPGWVGAAPIQNIGAYGQSLSDVCEAVEVFDLKDNSVAWWGAARCGFGYRHSVFKEHKGRFIVLKVRLSLRVGGAPTIAYEQLQQHLAACVSGRAPTLDEVRREVLALRASKSMVYDRADPNHRSAGSFFLNPILSPQGFARLKESASAQGLGEPPSWAEGAGFKVPAAWLIERAGFAKGSGEGRVGLSSQHTLALINRGGASAAELVAWARRVQLGVKERLGVWLEPEVNLWGFERPPLSPPLASARLGLPHTALTSQGSLSQARVALVTCEALPPWERDDAPLIAELEARGVSVSQPRWTDELTDWASFDLVLPRTTWDYHAHPQAFLSWLARVSELTRVANDPQLIRWNLNKRYLQELERDGALTPTTLWLEQVSEGEATPSPEELGERCAREGWARAFLKPVVAANAWGTLRFEVSDEGLKRAAEHLERWLPQRAMMLQAYRDEVERSGELSMIFFEGALSHGVQKVPREGDYRVQDDHGATDRPWTPPEAWVERARRLIQRLPELVGCEPPLYARFDCLPSAPLSDPSAEPLLIELELIEPSLFFRHDEAAPSRLAEAIVRRLHADLKAD